MRMLLLYSLAPQNKGIAGLKGILKIFVKALGLRTNLSKTEVHSITCENEQLDQILEGFLTTVKSFPCRYLGLPLHSKKLRKVDFIPLLDKIGGKLPSWKGKLMTKAARA
jgi:hypothetical protein